MSTKGGRGPSDAVQSAPRARVLLVTGMSGAGRSTALKILEDMGYESFDNLSAALVPALIETTIAGGAAMAVGADTGTRGFAAETMFGTLANVMRRGGRELRVLFIDCDDERLEQRYRETRRPHPLAGDRPIVDGIRRERQVVSPLRDHADLVIDTSTLTAADLKRLLTRHFSLDAPGLRLFVTSLAFRHGPPRDADLVFDLRFPENPHPENPHPENPHPENPHPENPHYVEGLRGLTGRDPAVAAHSETDAEFLPFFDRLWQLWRLLLSRYEISGNSYLTIATGCIAGRHCAAYVAERRAARLRDAGWRTEPAHRDLPLPAAMGSLSLGAFAAAG